MDKRELRKIVKAKLASMSALDKEEASQNLSRNLKDFLSELNSTTDIMGDGLIGGFSPMADELDWHLAFGKTDLTPCIPSINHSGTMEFYAVNWRLLAQGFIGLSLEGAFPLARPGLLIVPGLAFSKSGARLGRGKGYYDRYLAKNEVYKIGVCSELQLSEEIKTEDHDIPMDVVITDQNIYKG